MMDVMISSKMVRAITKYTLHAPGIISFTTHGNNYTNPDSQAAAKQSARTFSFINLFSTADIDQANLQQLDDVIMNYRKLVVHWSHSSSRSLLLSAFDTEPTPAASPSAAADSCKLKLSTDSSSFVFFTSCNIK